jgi:hypothetical protein
MGRLVRYHPVNSNIIALMMEASRTPETSADIDFITRQYIPEHSELPKESS